MKFILIQLIGCIGYSLLTASYFKKEKNKILYTQIIAYIMFTIHFYLLSGITGAICNAIVLVALIVIYLFEKNKWKNKNLIAWLFIGIIIIINIVTFQNIFSIFPMIGSVIVIISFLMNNENYIRGIGIISAICWLIYAVEVIIILGTIISYKEYRNWIGN